MQGGSPGFDGIPKVLGGRWELGGRVDSSIMRRVSCCLVRGAVGRGARPGSPQPRRRPFRTGPRRRDPAHEGLLGIASACAEAGVIRSEWPSSPSPACAGRRAPAQGRRVRDPARRLHPRRGGPARERPRTPASRAAPRGRHRQRAGAGTGGRAPRDGRTTSCGRARRSAASSRRCIDGPSVEGYLFPDTYQFVRGMSPEEMLGRMVQRLRGEAHARPARPRPGARARRASAPHARVHHRARGGGRRGACA